MSWKVLSQSTELTPQWSAPCEGKKNPSRCLFRREILCWGGVGVYYEVEKTNYPLSTLGLGNNDRQAHSLSETGEPFLWYLVPIEDVSKWRTQQMMPLKWRYYRKTLEFNDVEIWPNCAGSEEAYAVCTEVLHTHMLYHLSNKEPQEIVAMSTHHLIQKNI